MRSRWAAFAGVLGALACVGAVYLPLNFLAAARGVTVLDPAGLLGGVPVDARIPWLPWTFVLYEAYFAVFLVPVLVYPRDAAGARAFFRLCDGIVVAALVAGLVFLVCPAEMTLRVDAEPPDSALGAATRLLRRIDPPFNTWPSLHVALSCLTVLATRAWVGRRGRVLLWTFWALVSLSTLTVKQHYVWDVLTGALLGAAVWRLVVRTPRDAPRE